MRDLKGMKDDRSIEELKKVISDIANESEDKYKLVVEELNKMITEGGKINSQTFWK